VYQQKGAQEMQATQNTRILVIDDDRELTQLLQYTLGNSLENTQVSVTHDPYEAMNAMTEKDFDLILLDWNLPGLDGAQTLQKADQVFQFEPDVPRSWDSKPTPVVVLSGDLRSDCKVSKTKHFKYVGHINKKNKLNHIVEAIKKHLPKNYMNLCTVSK